MNRVDFVQLVHDLVEAMGQRLEAARPIAEGLALRTTDGYLYVFVADPDDVSTEAVKRWCREDDVTPDRLAVFSLGPRGSTWAEEIERSGGTVVAGPDFRRLVDELGIESPLVEKDPSIHRPLGSALPSARELDAEMIRAQTWFSAGVLPLAARFYGRAVTLKPEYLPGWVGLARAQTGVCAWDEAEEAWERVLALDPGSIEARLGLASVVGGRGDARNEISALRTILEAHPSTTAARVALVAALVDQHEWLSARKEIETLLQANPSEPRLHFLRAVVIERSGGEANVATLEREEARRLGLTEEAERDVLQSIAATTHASSVATSSRQAF